MQKKQKFKGLLVLGAGVMAALFEAGCTSNEFFGIEEDVEGGLDYPTMHEIACSQEFIEFQTQSFLNMKKLLDVDTTQMVLIDTIDGKLLYASKEIGNIRPVLEARRQLVETYPEYERSNAIEKEQIMNIALLNDRSLRKIANKNTPGVLMRTKSGNGESDAVKWISAKSSHEQVGENQWLVNGEYWYANTNVYNCINEALWRTECGQVEHGGYGWNSDGSGILIVDPNATIDHMTFWVWYNVPTPHYDFHVHPSGNLSPSPEDRDTWLNIMPTDYHIIFDISGNYEQYNIMNEFDSSGYIERN